MLGTTKEIRDNCKATTRQKMVNENKNTITDCTNLDTIVINRIGIYSTTRT